MTQTVAVIGAGAWGTALALLLAGKGHAVRLWMYEQDLAAEASRTRENRVYLPGFPLLPSITVTSSLETAVRDAPYVLSVVPSHTVRQVAARFAPLLVKDAVIISASKGIEIESLKPLSEVLKDALPPAFHGRLCFLSGPSFAKEVAQGMPTAVALACSDPELGLDLIRLLHAEQEFEHGAPVRPGDELTTEGEIVEVRSRGSLDFLTVRTETVNGSGERVLVARWTAVIRG